VTAVTGGALGFLYLGLSAWVIARRRSAQVGIGDGEDRDLARRIRVHANFSEYVPLCLVLMALNEAASHRPGWLVPCAVALVVGRLLHAVGLGRSSGATPPRFVGMTLTYASLGTLAGGGLYLALAGG
jgi:uncharacterized membrane protein YecN with MAPEG domain